MSLTIYPDNTSSSGGTIGGLVTGGTQGSVLFVGAGGVLAQDNAAFSFNPTTNTLSITKIAALNSGYGFANAGLTFATGSQIASNADGTFWIGASAVNAFLAFQVATGILTGNGLQIGWTSTSDPGLAGLDTGFTRIAAGIIKVTNGSTGAGCLELLEQTAPSAATANSVRIFAQDNGAGKTQLMALFASGAAQQIAIEP